jgi:hypothetical protein
MGINLVFPQMNRHFSLRCIRNDFFEFLVVYLERYGASRGRKYTYKIVKNAFVEFPLCRPALPQLMVIVIEAVPVFPEFGQAVLVYVFDSGKFHDC